MKKLLIILLYPLFAKAQVSVKDSTLKYESLFNYCMLYVKNDSLADVYLHKWEFWDTIYQRKLQKRYRDSLEKKYRVKLP